MSRKRKSFDPDADLDTEINTYEPSDSDDDYDDNEKLLLEKARKGKTLDDDDYDDDEEIGSDDEEEVLGVYSSEEEEDENKESGLNNADSDIEGMEDDKLPDPKAWGKQKRNYYHTDYVDQDYGGFAREEEEEMAAMEEKEARTLQSRLASQLEDVDLSLGLISKEMKKKQKGETLVEGEVEDDEAEDGLDYDEIKTDLSKLTKREKLALFQKESPEFFGLVNDYKERLTFAKDKLFPIMELIKLGCIPSTLPCARFVELKTHLTLNYCVNLAFYLVLKKKKIRVKDHPVISRLLTYRTLLQKMDELETPDFVKQLNDVVEKFKVEGDVEVTSDSKQNRSNKKKLKLLSSLVANNGMKGKIEKSKKENIKSQSSNEVNGNGDNFSDLLSDDNESDTDESDKDKSEPPSKKLKSNKFEDEDGKRPITYEIAKNKGLTPHRKKEQRNPRVKHRNKYRKALIRRKGQVRQVQNEVSKYGGEIFGIKASVIKSRRFK